MADTILWQPDSNWYMRIINVYKEQVYDFTAGGLSTAPGWANSYQALTFDSNIGGHLINLPTLPRGKYDLLFYDAASPASTDEVQVGIEWTIV